MTESAWDVEALRQERLSLILQQLHARSISLVIDETGDRKLEGIAYIPIEKRQTIGAKLVLKYMKRRSVFYQVDTLRSPVRRFACLQQ